MASEAERKSKKKRCAYRPCSPHTDLLISSFCFPNDPKRALIWLIACNRRDLFYLDIAKLHKNYALCEKHFEDKYISKGGTRKTLFAEAVPTLFNHIAGHVVRDGSAEHINFLKSVAPVDASHALLDAVIIEVIIPPPDISLKPINQSMEIVPSIPDPTITHPSNNSELMDVFIPLMENIPSMDFSVESNVQMESESSMPGPSGLHHFEEDSALLSPSRGTQLSAALTAGTPRNQKLQRKIKSSNKSLEIKFQKEGEWELKDFNDVCDKFLSEPLAKIVKKQAVLKHKELQVNGIQRN